MTCFEIPPRLSLISLIVALSVGCGSGTDSATGFKLEPMIWADCGELECGTVAVPLDHGKPSGPTIEIAVARLAAAVEPRIGVLIVNPGGPGASGVEMIESFGPFAAHEQLLGRFDLVGFDPRGVGASNPVRCYEDLDDEIEVLGSDEGLDEAVSAAEELVASCLALSGELAHHVGTNSAARDMDILRRALGEEKISYLGYSYGTRLGAVYAALFSSRVRAMVLDGPVDPQEQRSRPSRIQADGFEASWSAFVDQCAADPTCPLSNLGGADRALSSALEAAKIAPIPAGNRTVSHGEIYLGVFAGLYSPGTWSELADGIAEVIVDRSASKLQELGDLLTGRRTDGRYDNSQDAMFLIDCADDPQRPAPEAVFTATDTIANSLVRFGPAFRGSVGCYPLPPATDPLHVGPASLDVPALVVALKGDPATPPAWAPGLANTLGDALIVWSDANGHGGYLAHSWCLTETVTDYLIDLVVPLDGWSCKEPTWWEVG